MKKKKEDSRLMKVMKLADDVIRHKYKKMDDLIAKTLVHKK